MTMLCPVGHWNESDETVCGACGRPLAGRVAVVRDGKLHVTLADLDDLDDISVTRPPPQHRLPPPPPKPIVPTGPTVSPRFEVARAVPGRTTPLPNLGLHLSVDGRHVVTSQSEWVIARYGVAAAAWAAPQREPLASTTSIRLVPTFDGVGELVITSRRLAGVITHGTAVTGDVPTGPGAHLAWDFALTDIAEVGLDERQRWHGATDQVGLRVWCFEPAAAMLRLDISTVVDESGRESRLEDQREAMRLLVGAACDARMASADDDERVRLAEVRSGRWNVEGHTVTAEIAPVPTPGSSG